MTNINKFFNGRNDAINFVGEYSSMIIEAKRKMAEEEPEPEPSKATTKRQNLHLNCCEEFINEIKNDEIKKDEQIFKEYF